MVIFGGEKAAAMRIKTTTLKGKKYERNFVCAGGLLNNKTFMYLSSSAFTLSFVSIFAVNKFRKKK